MTDRRRINGPSNGTTPPVFAPPSTLKGPSLSTPRRRSRKPDELRRIFVKTGLVPSASGSAYLEIERNDNSRQQQRTDVTTGLSSISPPPSSSLKLHCAIHGPKPLPRSATFSSSLQISTYVKFAPFATRQRRGYVRDSRERDLSVHLETALKGVIIGDRWPKSGLDIIVTVLEGEDDDSGASIDGGVDGKPQPMAMTTHWGMMNVLAGCVSVASAALADARVDCLDLVAGGVAAVVELEQDGSEPDTYVEGGKRIVVVDQCPTEHGGRIVAACAVGYLACSGEITELWMKGDIPYSADTEARAHVGLENLIDAAVDCAARTRTVLVESVREGADLLVDRLTRSEREIHRGKIVGIDKQDQMVV